MCIRKLSYYILVSDNGLLSVCHYLKERWYIADCTYANKYSAFANLNQNTTTKNSQDIYFKMSSTKWMPFCLAYALWKTLPPPSPVYFQLIDYNNNAMPQVFNANSFW